MTIIAGFTAEAVLFDCLFRLDSLTVVGVVYTCVPIVTLTGSRIQENVTGIHLPRYTNDHVQHIFIQNQNLPFVPARIDSSFKNLRALRFENTNLHSISAKDLQPFPQLEYFMLYMNNLTSLDGDLFSYTPLLIRLYLRSNQIQHIGHDLVKNLNNLQYLFLGANACIEKDAATRAAVLELAPQLSVLCPPLDATTTIGTTTLATTTELPIEQCACGDEIEELRKENHQQKGEIQQQTLKIEQQNFKIWELQQSNDQLMEANRKLFKLNAAVESRLIEVEMKLREIVSMPCSKWHWMIYIYWFRCYLVITVTKLSKVFIIVPIAK